MPRIARARATIGYGIRIEDNLPLACARQRQFIILADDWRKIGDNGNRLFTGSFAQPGKDGAFGVIDDKPFKTLRLTIARVKRGLGSVEAVQILDFRPNAAMRRVLKHIPIQLTFFAPLASLRELLPHEEELLARIGPHERKIGAQIGELLPVVARQFLDQRGLGMNHLVVAERQNIILIERVNQPERQVLMRLLGMERVTL